MRITQNTAILGTPVLFPTHYYRQLLRVSGIRRVFFGEDFITITKQNEEEDWSLMKPEIFSTIMDFLQSGRSIIVDDYLPSGPEDTGLLQHE